MKKQYMLMILDGFGLREETEGNAIKLAKTPNLNRIFKEYPNTTLSASGLMVGLPEGQMGNSEVGHLNMGAGRIVYQELTRITKEIEEGGFNKNEAILGAISNAKKNDSALHIMGLLSDGGVHSHIDHIKACMNLAVHEGLNKVYLHAFTDGRDVPPTSGISYMEEINKYAESLSNSSQKVSIGVVSGRYYAMDRDKRWERVELAYDALTLGKGREADCPLEAVKFAYENGETDEFIIPTVCNKNAVIKDNDSVIFCNFRPDRAREITRALVDPGFDGFERKVFPKDLFYVTMTEYDPTIPNVHVAFSPERIENTLGEYVSKLGLKQLRIAETEKYAHVTFFFNGGVEEPNPSEDRNLIPSPKVPTYDLKPEMSAYEVTDKVLEALDSKKYDLIILNFANCDMVGHTGNLEAAIKAVEAVDICVGKIEEKMLSLGGEILLTADHGNADVMIAEDGSQMTAHSVNPVPLIYIADSKRDLKDGGKLADIAPTLLDIMKLEKPQEMTGRSLLEG